MEHVMDVSWMTHGKDNWSNHGSNWNSASNQPQDSSASNRPQRPMTPNKTDGKATPASPALPSTPTPTDSSISARSIPQRSGRTRSQSLEASPGQHSTPPQRKGSWFSNISSKFSASPAVSNTAPPTLTSEPDADDVTPLPKISPNKNAVLPHASRQSGDMPYIPAPPRSNQQGFLNVLRRLSSSNGPITQSSRASHGLVERKTLNVDKDRERCKVGGLSQAKLRRVAFCVDVEIAPMPKYADEETGPKKSVDKTQKRKMAEKSEGEALKNPKEIEEQKETAGVVKATGEVLPKEPEKEGIEATEEHVKVNGVAEEEPTREKETTRKKEKKKKSEAERKAKKEQKRKEALEKGAIPMELHLDTDSSVEDLSIRLGSPKTQSAPTTNPVRIYRRCCQLRETDILTKITLQLPKTTESCSNGVVEKLDLTGYYMSLSDLITLGDFLAVVPIRDVVLENCGLTDEGVRVVLAGLLAARKSTQNRQRKYGGKPADLTQQGGVVERLVLKNNSKIGVEGWKHICVFINMCRSIKYLDLSSLAFPAPLQPTNTPINHPPPPGHGPHPHIPIDFSFLLSRCIGERLAGSELELLNIGSIGFTAYQLGVIIDGVLRSGVTRLGLANNKIDAQGVKHVAKYLRKAKCEGLDLGGNDLRDHLPEIAAAFEDKDQLWAISLANCNLKPSSLCKLFHKLVKLHNFKFLDLSHNPALFESEPSAIGLLRKYLPQMECLRRLHLADVSLSSEQAIALAEILPEVQTLAHINLLENPNLVSLSNAVTEEGQEEACALYASLLAAARVSKALVKVDIENPSTESGEVVKALANRIVVYCMKNLQGVPDIRDSAGEDGQKLDKLPDVLRHLVGHEEDTPLVDSDTDSDPAPDEDYVIGGTGVVKALACVLKNRGDDSRRLSGEFTKDLETGVATPRAHLPPGKVKDMSKYLLVSARKIRARLQPALAMAKASSREDIQNYHRLVFLDQTIEGIIKRFEDEFPETRQTPSEAAASDRTTTTGPELGGSHSSLEIETGLMSDAEDAETELRSPKSRSRSNSIISHSSKALADEEGRALRVGHRFRRELIKQEHYDLLTGPEEIVHDPNHVEVISSMMDELMDGDEQIRRDIQDKGPIRAFQEHKEEIVKRFREADPQYWESFVEAQEKARANVQIETKSEVPQQQQDENAVVDDDEAIAD